MGIDVVTLAERAKAARGFCAALGGVLSHGMASAPGRLLLRDDDGHVIGEFGISGDMGGNDGIAEREAIAAMSGTAT